MLPYFRRAEAYAGGGDEYRGADGQLATRKGLLDNPLHEAWLAAGREAGYPYTADMNGFQQEGFARMDMTVAHGRRCSTANAYLRPAMRRSNLAVRTHALVTAVQFTGRRAIGVLAVERPNQSPGLRRRISEQARTGRRLVACRDVGARAVGGE